MKKLLAILLVTAMCAGLAACSKPAQQSGSEGEGASTTETTSETTDAAPTKLTLILRGGTYTDVIKAMLPEFEEENNVTCEVLDLAFADLHDKIALDAPNAKGAYDLIMVDGTWIPEFSENGVTLDLTKAGFELDDDFIEEVTVAGIGSDGDVYSVPYFGNVNVLFYNDALLESAGAEVPTTWEDVLSIAEKVKGTGKNGYLVRAQAGDNITSDFLPVLLSHGGWVFDDSGNVTIDTPEFKEALEFYISLKDAGTIMDKDDIVAAITNGDAALSLSWPGWYVPEEGGPAHYAVIPSKVSASSPEHASSIYGVWFLGVAANSQNPDLSVKLLEYITSKEQQIAGVANGGVPVRHSAYQDADVIAANPHFEIVYNALQSGVYRPLVVEWTEITLALGNELDAAVQGVKTVDQALADAQAAVEQIMQ
ncbi:MAG: extracellular solute-binding protein [Lachnospiraceae bacterium]|jgi:ABC-type glycerol-3-phosphate transport system substrate-binding protein|nr:extracellular solute-binding protein [Lachnospiraceae bacterium]